MPQKFELWPDTVPLWNEADTRDKPWMDWYVHPDGGERPCLLIFPGGGYHVRAPHEGEPFAYAAHAAGYHAAVCHYRVQWGETPQPLLHGPLWDAQRAMRLLRSDKNTFPVLDNKIAVIGFSAGGHLCAATSVHWRHPGPVEDDLADICARPDACIPCYAVISIDKSAKEKGSFMNLLGKNSDKTLYEFFSLEKHVDAECPPLFLWHTADDEIVPLQNSLCMAAAAQQHQVPVELHVFPHGKHGLGLAEDDKEVGQWWPLCVNWLKKYL
ncbi:MAG: alpha/beta hydrolase [Planctomycetes bacterium]|nr:alpha/beta hydrolase [Planctomycetota bacterium]